MGASMPALRSAAASSTWATPSQSAPAFNAAAPDDRGPVAVAVGLDHRAQPGRGRGGAQRAHVVAHGGEVDLGPGPGGHQRVPRVGRGAAARPAGPRPAGRVQLVQRRGQAVDHVGRHQPPARSAPCAARPCSHAPDAAASNAGHALRQQRPDHARQDVAGARGRQPGVAGRRQQGPPVGVGDDGGRALEQHDRPGGGGEAPGRREAVVAGRVAGEAGELAVVGRQDGRGRAVRRGRRRDRRRGRTGRRRRRGPARGPRPPPAAPRCRWGRCDRGRGRGRGRGPGRADRAPPCPTRPAGWRCRRPRWAGPGRGRGRARRRAPCPRPPAGRRGPPGGRRRSCPATRRPRRPRPATCGRRAGGAAPTPPRRRARPGRPGPGRRRARCRPARPRRRGPGRGGTAAPA